MAESGEPTKTSKLENWAPDECPREISKLNAGNGNSFHEKWSLASESRLAD